MGGKTIRYVVEHFHDGLPNARMRSRLRVLINHEFYQYQGDGPILLLICDTLASLIYAKRYGRTLIHNDDIEHSVVRVTTTGQIRMYGVTSKIWEVIG